jgi:hypothetical protein
MMPTKTAGEVISIPSACELHWTVAGNSILKVLFYDPTGNTEENHRNLRVYQEESAILGKKIS